MGQSPSLDKKHKLQYKVKNISKEFSMSYDPDFQLPPEMSMSMQQISQKFKVYLESVETEIPYRDSLLEIPTKTMKQLVYLHEKFLSKHQIPPLLPTLDGLNAVLQHIRVINTLDLQFAIKSTQLIEEVTKFLAQDCAIDSDKQCFCLNILAHIMQVLPEQELPTATLYQIATAMNPYHTINASLALEIFTQVCWQSDLGVEYVLSALDELRNKENWKYTMEPIFKLLEVQTNIFVLVNACTFLNTLVESHSNPLLRNSLKDELLLYGIGVIYGDIKHRILGGEYKAKDCTYKKLMKTLQDQKDKPQNSAVLKYYCRTLEHADLETPVDVKLFTKSSTSLFIEDQDKQAEEKIQLQEMMLRSQIEAFEDLMVHYEDTSSELIPEGMIMENDNFPIRLSIIEEDRPPDRRSDVGQQHSVRGSYIPQAQSVMIQSIRPSHQNVNQNMKVSMMKNSMVQQILVPDNLICQINQMLSKIRSARSMEEVVNHLTVFSEDASSVGVSVVTRLLDVLATKLQELSNQVKKDRFKKTRSREQLESNQSTQQEQIDKLQIEVKQLYQQKERIGLQISMDSYSKETVIQLEKEIRAVEKKDKTLIDQMKQDLLQRETYIQQQKIEQNDLIKQLDYKNEENAKLIKANQSIDMVKQKTKAMAQGITDMQTLMKLKTNQVKELQEQLKLQQMVVGQEDSDIKNQVLSQFLEKGRAENKESRQKIIHLEDQLELASKVNHELVEKAEESKQQVLKQAEQKTDQIQTMSTPPPPPPPPPPLTMIAGVAPPPPPPMFGIQQKKEPTKVKRNPSRPMKQLLQKVPWQLVKFDAVKGTIWDGMNETDVKIDQPSIEEMFGARPTFKPSEEQTIVKKVEIKKVSLLPPDRQKNIELILGRLRISFSLIRECIFSCDTQVLTQNVIEYLVNACPQDTEISLYAHPEDLDASTLAPPDMFFLEVSSIPRYSDRLNSFLSQYNCQDFHDDLKKRVAQFDTTLRVISKDEGFKTLFKYALAYGNYLNGQGNKGGAFGFKLDSLIKTADVKSNDGKQSLFMIIIQEAEKDIKTDLLNSQLHGLMNIELLSKMPISQLASDLQELKKTHKYVDKAIASQSLHPSDRAEEHFSPLSSKLIEYIGSLEVSISKVESLYDSLCNYYVESSKSLTSDKFFEIVQGIWAAYKRCKEQSERQRLQAQKELERQRLLEYRKRQSTLKDNEKQEAKEKLSMNQNNVAGLQKLSKDDVLIELRMRQSMRYVGKQQTL